jgi:hypothetical protein
MTDQERDELQAVMKARKFGQMRLEGDNLFTRDGVFVCAVTDPKATADTITQLSDWTRMPPMAEIIYHLRAANEGPGL